MGRMVQYFGKNTWVWGQRSVFMLFLVLTVVFSSACSSGKIPCPEVDKATAKAKKQKKNKNKVVKTKMVEGDAGDGSEIATEEAPAVDETAEASTEKKPNLSTKKNNYNKNGLLQKKKYKRLKSNPGKKKMRAGNGNFFSRLFSGGGKSKTKSKARRTTNVEPVDE